MLKIHAADAIQETLVRQTLVEVPMRTIYVGALSRDPSNLRNFRKLLLQTQNRRRPTGDL